MNKININGLTQGCTAEQLNAIAWNILHRNGDVDMSGCNVTITPPSGMRIDMAGIIVRCATESGGTVNINGAMEIEDDIWNLIKEYGSEYWMVKANTDYGIPFETMRNGNIYEGLPTYNDTNNGLASEWMYSGVVSALPDNWNIKEWSYYQSWTKSYIGIGGFWGYVMWSKFFVPTKLPTKLHFYYDQYPRIYINGNLVWSREGFNGGKQTFDIDFSQYMKVGQCCHICITLSNDNGGSAAYFGFE